MKRFAVSLLTFALCVIMIAQLSSALIIQSHSKQIQTYNEEDTLGIRHQDPYQIGFLGKSILAFSNL